MSRDHFAVEVWRNGESLLTIETTSVAGKDLSPEDEEVIREAAHHLLAFVGKRSPDMAIEGDGSTPTDMAKDGALLGDD